MTRHQKTLLRTDEHPEAPWKVGCTCSWSAFAADPKAAGKLHTAHRKITRANYRLTRMVGGVQLYVFGVPPNGGNWTYTQDPALAAVVNETTKSRYMRHLWACGIKGTALVATGDLPPSP